MPVNDDILPDQAEGPLGVRGIDDDGGADVWATAARSSAVSARRRRRGDRIDAIRGRRPGGRKGHRRFRLADSGAPFYPPSLGTAGSAAGYSNLIDSYFYDLVATGAGILMLVHGLSDRSERGWVLLA